MARISLHFILMCEHLCQVAVRMACHRAPDVHMFPLKVPLQVAQDILNHPLVRLDAKPRSLLMPVGRRCNDQMPAAQSHGWPSM